MTNQFLYKHREFITLLGGVALLADHRNMPRSVQFDLVEVLARE